MSVTMLCYSSQANVIYIQGKFMLVFNNVY